MSSTRGSASPADDRPRGMSMIWGRAVRVSRNAPRGRFRAAAARFAAASSPPSRYCQGEVRSPLPPLPALAPFAATLDADCRSGTGRPFGRRLQATISLPGDRLRLTFLRFAENLRRDASRPRPRLRLLRAEAASHFSARTGADDSPKRARSGAAGRPVVSRRRREHSQACN